MGWRLLLMGISAIVLFGSSAAHYQPGTAFGGIFLMLGFFLVLGCRND
jgi:hypothetical protein